MATETQQAPQVTGPSLEALAHHEAGHAVVAKALGLKVTSIQLDGDGMTYVSGDQWPAPMHMVTLLLAGAEAESRITGVWRIGKGHPRRDWDWALEWAGKLVAPDMAPEFLEAMRATVVKDMVTQHWAAIEALARELNASRQNGQ